MGTFYLDIETVGLNPLRDKIVTIQYQELERKSGKAKGELVILKEWESSERDILRRFAFESGILSENDFSFVSVGFNLNFEHKFLVERTREHGLPCCSVLGRPFIDLRPLGVLMNNGEFKGSGLDKISGKPSDGRMVPQWYADKDFEKIVSYVETEAREFIRLNSWLYEEMPKLREKFMNSLE